MLVMSMTKKRSQAEIEADARRTGRPPGPPHKKRDKVVSVRVTAAERERLHKEAARRGCGLSDVLMEPWRKSQ
jgi:hypothetical protein